MKISPTASVLARFSTSGHVYLSHSQFSASFRLLPASTGIADLVPTYMTYVKDAINTETTMKRHVETFDALGLLHWTEPREFDQCILVKPRTYMQFHSASTMFLLLCRHMIEIVTSSRS